MLYDVAPETEFQLMVVDAVVVVLPPTVPLAPAADPPPEVPPLVAPVAVTPVGADGELPVVVLVSGPVMLLLLPPPQDKIPKITDIKTNAIRFCRVDIFISSLYKLKNTAL